MKILTHSYALSAFDGKILLRLILDKPAEGGTRVWDYLYDYSCKIEVFARQRLFSRLLELYEMSYNNNTRLQAYIYSFKIICTYECEDLFSCLLISSLYQGNVLLYSNADSLIALNDYFVPPKLICRRSMQGSNLIISQDCTPTWVNAKSEQIVYTLAEKHRWPL